MALVAQTEARRTKASRKPRRQELETAKEILALIFGVRSDEVEGMIQQRLEERGESGGGKLLLNN
jgi:hypothetical protein